MVAESFSFGKEVFVFCVGLQSSFHVCGLRLLSSLFRMQVPFAVFLRCFFRLIWPSVNRQPHTQKRTLKDQVLLSNHENQSNLGSTVLQQKRLYLLPQKRLYILPQTCLKVTLRVKVLRSAFKRPQPHGFGFLRTFGGLARQRTVRLHMFTVGIGFPVFFVCFSCGFVLRVCLLHVFL